MESLPKDKILQFNANTLQAVRKTYEMDEPGQMSGAVDILQEWLKKQRHLTKKDFSREYLDRVIISTKGSVERAKTRIDKVCTIKTLMPDLFEGYDVRNYFKELNDNVAIHAALPMPTEDNYRIIAMRHFGVYNTSKLPLDYHRLLIILTEYLRRHDYTVGTIYLIDLTGYDFFAFARNVDILELRQFIVLILEGYGVRIKAIHFMSTSKYIDVLLNLLKQVFSEKVGNRFIVHKTAESIQKHIPKDLLPADFGGNLKTVREFHEDWLEVLASEEFTEYIREMNNARTDEALRPTDKFNDEYMGMPGTFRGLKVD